MFGQLEMGHTFSFTDRNKQFLISKHTGFSPIAAAASPSLPSEGQSLAPEANTGARHSKEYQTHL